MAIPTDRNPTAFIGFVFNGEHSINDHRIYRTSDGSRYNHNLIPQLNDKTADVPGGHGQYYFNSTYKTRQFSVPIAFDNLSETQFDGMKKWLAGTGIHELSFDEKPDVKYSAKVTGTPQLKFICFDEEYTTTTGTGDSAITTTGIRNVYKGEGTIQFTCYFPFGYTEATPWTKTATSVSNLNINESISVGGDIGTTFVFETTGVIGEVEIGDLKITPSQDSFTWNSSTGLVINTNEIPIAYTGTSYGLIGPENINLKFTIKKGCTAELSWKKLYL